jgi:hypothetical protein
MEINEDKSNSPLGQVVVEMGAAANGPLISIGDKLGLYKTLGKSDSLSSAELAAKTQTAERYVREWLAVQAASGYVECNAENDHFFMTPEQFAVFGDRNSPAFMTGVFYVIASLYHDEAKILEAFKTGEEGSWGEHNNCLFFGTKKFFSPSYETNLVDSWLPSLEGVTEKLTQGAKVAAIGCGHAASTIIMAKAFAKSHFVGIDFHQESIEKAHVRAKEAGISNIEFKVATAKD